MIVRVHSFTPGKGDDIAKALFTRTTDDQTRARAVEGLNHYGKRFGDLVTGQRPLDKGELMLDLSSADRFPTNDPQMPTVLFQTSDRLAVDVSWTQLFDVRDFRGSMEEGFDIADVYDAVTFEIVPDGVAINVGGVRGAETNYKFQDIGGGFQYSKNWLSDNKFWRFVNGMSAMQARYGTRLAQLAWQVATASGLSTTTRDTAGSTTLAKDINTINAAATEILNALYTATDADGNTVDEEVAGPRFILAYHPLTAGYLGRVQAIMAAGFGVPNDVSGGQQLAYPTVPLGSVHVPTGNFYLFLGRRKFVTGIRQDLEVFEDYDPYKRTYAHPGYGRYKHVRGDSNQGRIVPLS